MKLFDIFHRFLGFFVLLHFFLYANNVSVVYVLYFYEARDVAMLYCLHDNEDCKGKCYPSNLSEAKDMNGTPNLIVQFHDNKITPILLDIPIQPPQPSFLQYLLQKPSFPCDGFGRSVFQPPEKLG